VTSQDVQQGIDIATDVLSVLTTVLKPAVEASNELCNQLLKDGSPSRETALIDCLKINDAWNHVLHMNNEFQEAVAQANKAKSDKERSDTRSQVDSALERLKQAIEELRDVLSKSTLTSGGSS
jgi:predicted ribosome quality control (RQC) complex YloA/Tae2 family protein